ncbi:MAG: insulinase family protein [Acidobacteria bacterium]|nr:insulinase family protein [Acidobacteriota bacterium]MCI0719015.1 insulinase family protein [Acidobacteriota bacterium]
MSVELNIPFEKYRLDNGLQVILHYDPKLPVVHVNLWYHVGSKNEKPERTGFAHLFEHMMFQGSKHADGEYITYVEKAGANLREGGVNGTTSFDRTNYFQTVPREALEYALWLESDRMGFLTDALTQEKFDNQRAVVKNERRQSYENVPYGRAIQMIFENLFPKGHPYSWLVIGSQEHLDAATLEDVKNFFNTYYTPNNCSLVVAGDFEIEEAKRLVEKYFGPFPPGPALERPVQWVPRLEGEKRITVADRIPQERLYLVWPTTGYFRADDAELDLASHILSQGKNSRLYKTLVYDKQIASDVSAFNYSLEIAGLFGIIATARPSQSLGELEQVILEEVNRFAELGPSEEELLREKAKQEFDFVNGLERLGGFGGKADLLNQYNTYLGSPGYFAEDYERFDRVNAGGIRHVARQYLSTPNRLAVTFTPEASDRPKAVEFDRSRAPAFGVKKPFTPPELRSAQLANGLRVIVCERRALPKAAVGLVVRSGGADDPANLAGTAWMTAEMLDEGTTSRSALQIQAELDLLGTSLGTSAESEVSHVSLETLRKHLRPSLEVMADLILNPAFPEEELERQRRQRLDGILQERNSPPNIARKVFRTVLFGENHPFGREVAGHEASVQTITRDNLETFYRSYWKPNHGALIFAGDVDLDEAVRLAEDLLGSWQRAVIPSAEMPLVRPPQALRVCLIDRHDAPQSQVRFGSIGPRRSTEDLYAIELMNTVLGGAFSSRLNMNLREDKGYTYGASSVFAYGRRLGFWAAGAGVQTQFTRETLLEFRKELQQIREERMITAEELEMAKTNLTRGFAQRFETLGRLVDQVVDVVSFDLPLEDIQRYPQAIHEVSLVQAREAARQYLTPDNAVAVIVGDLKQIEQPIRDLNLGEVSILDARGKPVR